MKQGCAAFWVHVCNVIMSLILEETQERGSDQCASYFVEVLMDATLGVALTIGIITLVDKLIERNKKKL